MSEIEWCDHAANNIVTGCSPSSPGCHNCWAARSSGTRQRHRPALIDGQGSEMPWRGTRADLVTPGTRPGGGLRPVYNGRVVLDPSRLAAVLTIPGGGGKAGNRVFWNSTSDTFHERISFTEIAAQFALMAARPDLRFLVLTKWPERAKEFAAWMTLSAQRLMDTDDLEEMWARGLVLKGSLNHAGWPRRLHPDDIRVPSWPLPHVAIGVTAENQKWWDRRVPELLQIPAAYRFVSVEPMLGPIVPDVMDGSWWDTEGAQNYNPFTGVAWWSNGEHGLGGGPTINQVIIGAESGPGAREMPLKWAQDLGRQVLDGQAQLFAKQADVCAVCAADPAEMGACVACGARLDRDGTGRAGRVRKGCPEIWIPGHGRASYQGHFWGAL